MSVVVWITVAVGGALGAVARYGMTQLVQHKAGWATPTATGVVNVLGCFLLGALLALLPTWDAPERWRLLLGVGLLGSFTTFSTWSLDSLLLVEQGRWASAALNVGVQVTLGVLALVAGRGLVGALVR